MGKAKRAWKMAIDENANAQYETAQELFSMLSLEEQQHLIEVLET